MEDRKLNQDFVPLLTIMSTDFEKDLEIVKRVLGDFEQKTHSENGFKFSDRPEMAAGWWFYDVLVSREFLQNLFRILMPEGIGEDRKSASLKLVEAFQEQTSKLGSEARVKMHGKIPFAAPWWAWLMR